MKMKYSFIINVFFIAQIIGCQSNSPVELTSFKTYELDTMNYGLGLDTCLIEIVRNGNYNKIKLIQEVASYYPGEHIRGDFYVRNDTIFLSTKYDKSKDKYPNSHFLSLSSVVYEYSFCTDTFYQYYADNIRNCEIFEK